MEGKGNQGAGHPLSSRHCLKASCFFIPSLPFQMDLFFLTTICVSPIIYLIILRLFFSGGPKKGIGDKTNLCKLPPGPTSIPIITNLSWLVKTFSEIEALLRNIHAKYGPIVTLRIGPRPAIFISDRSLAHKALVQMGAIFADRPPTFETDRIISANNHNVNSAFYGSTWRLLRRNLTSEILHPSRIKSYSVARKWVLEILQNRLVSHSPELPVAGHFQYAMFCLLVLMCFGDKLGEDQVNKIEKVQREFLLSINSWNLLNFWPAITKILFPKRWENFFRLLKNKEDVHIPLIEARRKLKEEKLSREKQLHEKEENQEASIAYVDTLLSIELPEEKRKLENSEIVSLCSELLDAGTDTTTSALQWTMANLVKYPRIQEKLFQEMRGILELPEEEVKEEQLGKLPYLKAVVLESLRRHPPGHFVLPHAVTEDVVFDSYLIPKNGSVNFLIAEMGRDPKVWEDPMEFKPERFLNGKEAFDLTGSKEIKMIPFGAGRRMCPGYSLALLHLEYFVANLVWKFEWKAIEGDEVDLSEKEEFTVVMKNPLKAVVTARIKA